MAAKWPVRKHLFIDELLEDLGASWIDHSFTEENIDWLRKIGTALHLTE